MHKRLPLLIVEVQIDEKGKGESKASRDERQQMRSDRNSNHRYDNMEDTGGSKNSFFLMIVVLEILYILDPHSHSALRTPPNSSLVGSR